MERRRGGGGGRRQGTKREHAECSHDTLIRSTWARGTKTVYVLSRDSLTTLKTWVFAKLLDGRRWRGSVRCTATRTLLSAQPARLICLPACGNGENAQPLLLRV